MHCWARWLFIAMVAVLGVLSMLSACGQKGALYLPESAPEPGTEVPDAVPESVPMPGQALSGMAARSTAAARSS